MQQNAGNGEDKKKATSRKGSEKIGGKPWALPSEQAFSMIKDSLA